MRRVILSAVAVLVASVTPCLATSGPGCLIVTNVADGDVLNVRSKPSANATVVDRLSPNKHGIIHLDGKCVPNNIAWASRWCPVTHYDGDNTSKGWVKARFVRDSDCP